MKKSLLVGAGALLLVSGITLAVAEPGGFGHCDGFKGRGAGTMGGPAMLGFEGRHGRGMATLAAQLELTPEQEAQAFDLMQAHQKSAFALRQSLRGGQAQLQALNPASTDYSEQLERLASSQGQLMAGMIKLHADLQGKLQALLTPDQQGQWQELQERGGRGHGHPEQRW